MAKKIFAVFCIILACGLLFVVGSAVALFLAPGMEIFGIRYVASGLSKCEVDRRIDRFSGDIYIETQNVPITFNYTDYYSTSVAFSQNFIGFTKSKQDVASVDIGINKSGDLIVKTHEIEKWIYAQDGGSYFKLVLTLPRALINGKSVSIKSKTSNLVINGSASYQNFSMVSEGGLTINNSIAVANNFKYHTSKAITINDKINSTNYDLRSYSSNITIKKAVEDLKVQTNSGDVKFVSAKSLIAKTESGSIRGYGEGLVSIAETVDVKTRSGSITLGSVSSKNNNAICNIQTRSGAVHISKMYDGEITGERGAVYIGEARRIIVNNNVGNITVNTVSDMLIVNGRNGKVVLGEKGVINNPTIKTTTGTISLKNATGIVDVKSSSNNVSFKNLSSTDINLHAGKSLKATGLKGVVDIYANGDCDLTFASITGDVNVNVGNKCDDVKINATCIAFDKVDYYLKSTKGKKAKVYAGAELLKSGSTISSGTKNTYAINVLGAYAKIVLKLAV